ncbi:MAG TPA: acyl transferase, partial [Parafilimonas sp.]|nr:acyl transferase [Parafilimonas sp.]
MNASFVNKTLQDSTSFHSAVHEGFLYQYNSNKVYREWCGALGFDFHNGVTLQKIPFLPISFFKTSKVICEDADFEVVFESSGTTGSSKSRHYVKDLSVYIDSFIKCFGLFYGDVTGWCIIGLLPSYLEQTNSSLVKMVNVLIRRSGNELSGFYLNDFRRLNETLRALESIGQKTLLIGVTYALLDIAEQFPMQLSSTIVMETGGMKGRRKEMTREEVHKILKKQFCIEAVHSEYGMTELLSQAYSKGDGRFYCPPWMKVFVRDEEDPMLVKDQGRGALNIIDLANIYSCAFIATDDIG